jgi:ABC-2 type transport system ATP-binding protein
VTKRWPGAAPVLHEVDLDVPSGKVIAIHGDNGAGKTTLLRIAAGLITAETGSVRVGGRAPDRDGTEFRRQIGFVSAGNSGLYARLRAEQHLDLWARLALLDRRARGPAIDRVERSFDLTPLRGQRVDRLSMGQRQRLRLALGFLHDPTLVLLDEPTTSLDEHGIDLLGGALRELKERAGAALVCTPSSSADVPAVDARLTLTHGTLVTVP